MNADMLGFLCFYSIMCSDNSRRASSKRGAGTDMALSSASLSQSMLAGNSDAAPDMESPQPPYTSTLTSTSTTKNPGPETMLLSQSPLLLHTQPPEPELRVNGVCPESAEWPRSNSITHPESAPEDCQELHEEVKATELSSLPFIPESESQVEQGDPGRADFREISPKLPSIPEEAVEYYRVYETHTEPVPSLQSVSISTATEAVDYATEEATATAWASSPPPNPETAPAPVVVDSEPIQDSIPVPPSPILSPHIQSAAEDAADTSSTTTNDETTSIFDDEYYSDTSSYTASLLSDVKDYTYENGRRYHSYREGHYVLPNDDQEQDRQDLLHHVRNLVLNGSLFCAPVGENAQRVLDIGTGTGIWAIDFADTFPSAEVVGTDLSPIQPSWVPPNLRFLVDDAESPWLFSASRPFDFIHARDLGGAIADWPRLLRQAYTHLRPGGWIELQEFEVTLRSDDDSLRLAPMLCEFVGRLHQASEAFHRPMNIAEGHKQRLIEAGFEDVRDEVYKVRQCPSL